MNAVEHFAQAQRLLFSVPIAPAESWDAIRMENLAAAQAHATLAVAALLADPEVPNGAVEQAARRQSWRFELAKGEEDYA